MEDAILLKVKQSEFFQRIATSDAICVLLGGSRVNALSDELSDYDLTIVCVNGSADCRGADDYRDIKEYLMCDGKKIHWYFWTIDELLNCDRIKFPLLWAGLLKMYWLSDEHVLYVGERWRNQFQYFLTRKNEIANKAASALCNHYKDLICSIALKETVPEENYTKFLYHLTLCSYIFSQQYDITEFDKVLLMELKRIRRRPITSDTTQYCVNRLKLIRDEMGW